MHTFTKNRVPTAFLVNTTLNLCFYNSIKIRKMFYYYYYHYYYYYFHFCIKVKLMYWFLQNLKLFGGQLGMILTVLTNVQYGIVSTALNLFL